MVPDTAMLAGHSILFEWAFRKCEPPVPCVRGDLVTGYGEHGLSTDNE